MSILKKILHTINPMQLAAPGTKAGKVGMALGKAGAVAGIAAGAVAAAPAVAGALGVGGGAAASTTGGTVAKSGVLQKILGGAKAIGKQALKHPDKVLAGAQAISTAKSQSKAGDQRQKALDLAIQRYSDQAPIRDAILKRILQDGPKKPNLSGTFKQPGQVY